MVTPAARLAHGIDVGAVERAIDAAERRTSAEIRVAVARSWFWGGARAAADRAFRRLQMSQTRGRNGVLIFIAPSRRKLVVLGDVGVQAKVAPDLWMRVVERIAADFRRGDRTAGLVAAVALLADALAPVFPVGSRDVNELANTVSFEET